MHRSRTMKSLRNDMNCMHCDSCRPIGDAFKHVSRGYVIILVGWMWVCEASSETKHRWASVLVARLGSGLHSKVNRAGSLKFQGKNPSLVRHRTTAPLLEERVEE